MRNRAPDTGPYVVASPKPSSDGADDGAEGLHAGVPETKIRDELSRQRADDPRRRSRRGRGACDDDRHVDVSSSMVITSASLAPEGLPSMTVGSPLDTRAVTGTNLGSGQTLASSLREQATLARRRPGQGPGVAPGRAPRSGAHLLVTVCVSNPVRVPACAQVRSARWTATPRSAAIPASRSPMLRSVPNQSWCPNARPAARVSTMSRPPVR